MRRLLQITLFNLITGRSGGGQYKLLEKIATHLPSSYMLTPPLKRSFLYILLTPF